VKRLAILRHAKSSWDDPALDDFNRPLNKRGWKAAQRMGAEFARRGLRFDHVLASTAARVRETIEGLGQELDLGASIDFDPDIYLANEATLLSRVRALPESTKAPLIVGHNPGLERLLLGLTRNDSAGFRAIVAEGYPTAAFAVVELPAGRWDEVEPGNGKIVELTLPRELD